MNRLLLNTLSVLILLGSGCSEYKRGEKYTSNLPGDELQYVIAFSGRGVKLSEKANQMKISHESKGDSVTIKYLSDSVLLQQHKGVLLFNSTLPDIKEDMLSKGYFGTFTSKQLITCLLVSYKDFDRFFKSTK